MPTGVLLPDAHGRQLGAVALDVGDALLHPCRGRRALQVVIEVLLQADGVILLVGPLAQSVRFAVVIEEVDFLTQAAQCQVELDALIPWHRVVAIVVQQHDRRPHAVRPENGRVLDEARRVLTDGSADAALRALVLALPRDARAPAYAV